MKEKQTIKLPLTYPVKTGYKPDWIDFTIPEEVYDKAMNADRVKEMLKNRLLKVYLICDRFISDFIPDPSLDIGTIIEINDDSVSIEFNEDNCIKLTIDMLKDCTVSSAWLGNFGPDMVLKDDLNFIGYYLSKNSHIVTMKDDKLEEIIPDFVKVLSKVIDDEKKE